MFLLLVFFLIVFIRVRENHLMAEQLRLETMVQIKTIDLEIEKDNSDRLLKNILPEPIAQRLKTSVNKTIADKFENVAVLGPVRPTSQIEFAKSDCFALGIMGAIRESGDIEGTPGVELRTENGSVKLENGLIIAKRHIHMTPEDAKEFNVTDKEVVSVKLESEGRSLTFGDVVVRVSDKFSLAMHIDTDEGNASNVGNGDGTKATIVK